MKPQGCKATNLEGNPCGAQHYRDGWCRWHHPALADERRESARRGGYARSNAARATKALKQYEGADLYGILCGVLDGLLEGKHEPGVANAAANVAKAISAIKQSQEMEARLQELEEVLKRGKIA